MSWTETFLLLGKEIDLGNILLLVRSSAMGSITWGDLKEPTGKF